MDPKRQYACDNEFRQEGNVTMPIFNPAKRNQQLTSNIYTSFPKMKLHQ